MQKIIWALLAFASVSSFSLYADTSEGESLERALWSNMDDHYWSTIENSIAPQFQSVHPDGARNKAQELALIKNLDIGKYELSNFKVTETKNDTLIVTYLIAVHEVIDKEKMSGQKAPRLSIWQKIDGKWLWIAHANLNPMPDAVK